MNMSKKILCILLVVFSFFICSTNTNAAVGLGHKTKSSNDTEQVLEKPCEQDELIQVLKIAGFVLLVAKLIVPLLIIGFGTFDLFKAITDKDEKSLSKQVKILLVRVVIGLIVFFLPSLVNAIFNGTGMNDEIEKNGYKACYNALLYPTKSKSELMMEDLGKGVGSSVSGAASESLKSVCKYYKYRDLCNEKSWCTWDSSQKVCNAK